MKCPKCRKIEMDRETYEGIEIDRCPACKGMFLDRGELKALISKDQGNVADNLAFSPTSDTMDAIEAHCFRCNKKMTPVQAPGDVLVNLCENCGAIFLDQGELATLQLHAHQV
ncbi:MAG: zf-TFIIB domain-containing protein [Deltaproteobacteria bacterium]|nr:zf-TFIIB domain-containing protein [Deltaproteobacteria bacterium]